MAQTVSGRPRIAEDRVQYQYYRTEPSNTLLQIVMERYLFQIHITQSYVHISAQLFFEKY